AAVAAGVVVGAFLIKLTGWQWIDPTISLLINATIILGTWHLLYESLCMSLAGVPRSVSQTTVRAYLAGLPGVDAVHDLHIWAMSTSETALTVHLVMRAGHPGDAFLMQTCKTLRETHGIGHATMQVETDDTTVCALAPAHVV
uniref:cation diffusion facilitator family transporter n=1 Tax=Beijerinckia sp. L45 TaxID=1641855 RepID=UPI00131DAA57